jgi:formylglycine-generating enzyme required for sulfatase activity
MRSVVIAVFAVLLALGIMPAHAEKRMALVVGNNRYANLSREQLQKAVSDAQAVGRALREIKFDDVIVGENLGRQAFVDKLDELAGKLSPGDTAFFFFSGHGVVLDGVNYVLPADVPDVAAGQVTRLKGAALAEDYITSELLRSGARVAVVVLDACRNNPFARGGAKGVGAEKGLQPREPPSGVFTLYAAGRNEAALDRLYDGDRDPNGVFTRALLPALTRPGVDLTGIAIEVKEQVTRLAGSVKQEQHPAYYDGTSGGRIYLAGLPPVNNGGGMVAPPPGPTPDEVVWSYLKDSRDLEKIARFIEDFPLSPRRKDAEQLRATLLAAVTLVVRPQPDDPCSGAVTVSLSSRCAAPLNAAQERALKPKNAFKECENCPEMVVVPAGSFTVGSPKTEPGRYDDEEPQHTVKIDKPFAVGRLHVTRGQFAAFVEATHYDAGSKCYAFDNGQWGERSDRSWRNPGFAQEDSHPAVCLNWNDAKAYVDWLAKKTGKAYRLLSEAEWEYAARARTTPGAYPRFWFGNDEKDLCKYGNGADQQAHSSIEGAKGWTVAPCNDGYAYTSPAGHFPANEFGLNDMFGNAWQWTADCYNGTYDKAPTDGTAWTTGDCGPRVVRGGSWVNLPRNLRAAGRGRNTSDYRGDNNGFRVGRTLTP